MNVYSRNENGSHGCISNIPLPKCVTACDVGKSAIVEKGYQVLTSISHTNLSVAKRKGCLRPEKTRSYTTLHVVLLGGGNCYFFFFEAGLKFDDKSISNSLEVEELLVKCLFWGGCNHPNTTYQSRCLTLSDHYSIIEANNE